MKNKGSSEEKRGSNPVLDLIIQRLMSIYVNLEIWDTRRRLREKRRQ